MSFLGYQIGDMLTSITANKFQVMLHEKIIIDRGKKKRISSGRLPNFCRHL